MHTERLTRLLNLVANHDDKRAPVRINFKYFKKEIECGTYVCACGLAGLDPWFNEQGFTLGTSRGWQEEGRYWSPRFEGNYSWIAVMKFFDLRPTPTDYLFLSSSYRVSAGGLAVEMFVDRLSEFIKSGGVTPPRPWPILCREVSANEARENW